jgi:hypothetical protein
MQSKTARTMQGSVNLANLGLLEFRLAWGLGAGHHCKTRKLLLASGIPASTTLAATTTRVPAFETPTPTQRATKKTATAPTNKAIEISTEGFN